MNINTDAVLICSLQTNPHEMFELHLYCTDKNFSHDNTTEVPPEILALVKRGSCGVSLTLNFG